MQKFTGQLVFSGSWLDRPWALIQPDGLKVDLYPLINETLLKLNGKTVEYKQDYGSFGLAHTDGAEMVIEYEADSLAILNKPDDRGTLNIGASLPNSLTRLSGRKVEVEFSDDGFKIVADSTEEVFGVQYFGLGNSCRIPEGAERTVCRIGTPDCCIFMAGGKDGFICEKFSAQGRHLLGLHFQRSMRASRVGNCVCVGREEDATPKDPNTPTMDLETKPGDKVLFNKPNRGYEYDTECALMHLVVGDEYTVDRLEVGNCSSRVFFKEVPDIGFNTVHFQDVSQPAEAR